MQDSNNIPEELRATASWIRCNGKAPIAKYKTDEDKTANLRPYADAARKQRPNEGMARLIRKGEGYVFIDLDGVRNAATDEVQPWAESIIAEFSTYCELSRSGTGFHLVVRGDLPRDYHKDYPDPARPGHNKCVPIEIYSGNIPNKTFSFTGDVYETNFTLADGKRTEQLNRLLERCEAGEFGGPAHKQVAIDWRHQFHTVDELPDGDIRFLIHNILPEGVAFIGALSGSGKTWFCLAMARALTSGKKFLGNWTVPEPVEVLYLCPEMSAKTFKKRCRLFGISERFHCQTIADGAPLDLYDPILTQAVAELKPVVFLDTAIRFAGAEDENSASQNAHGMAKAVFRLLHLGAQAVVCLHHRAKDTARIEELTLENTLRGTGDLGAMCDVVWGLQYDKGNGDPQYAKDSKRLVRLRVACVKARDFVAPDDFRIQLGGYIERIGDFAEVADDSPDSQRETEINALDEAIAANPKIEKLKLEEITGIGRNRQEALAAERGWAFDKKTKWTRQTPELIQ